MTPLPITMVVGEVVTLRRTVTVEFDPHGHCPPSQLLRNAFSSGLGAMLTGADYDAVASEGLTFFAMEEDADNHEPVDPDDLTEDEDDEGAVA